MWQVSILWHVACQCVCHIDSIMLKEYINLFMRQHDIMGLCCFLSRIDPFKSIHSQLPLSPLQDCLCIFHSIKLSLNVLQLLCPTLAPWKDSWHVMIFHSRQCGPDFYIFNVQWCVGQRCCCWWTMENLEGGILWEDPRGPKLSGRRIESHP